MYSDWITFNNVMTYPSYLEFIRCGRIIIRSYVLQFPILIHSVQLAWVIQHLTGPFTIWNIWSIMYQPARFDWLHQFHISSTIYKPASLDWLNQFHMPFDHMVIVRCPWVILKWGIPVHTVIINVEDFTL